MSIGNSVRRLLLLKFVLHFLFADAIYGLRPNSAYADPFWLTCGCSICIKRPFSIQDGITFCRKWIPGHKWVMHIKVSLLQCENTKKRRIIRHTDVISENKRLKPQSDIHCNRSTTSPRPKFITIAEVAEESQLGFAVGRRLVGDWSATDRGLVADWSATSFWPLCDLMQLVADRSGTSPRLIAHQSPIGRRPSKLKSEMKKKNIDTIF